MSVGPQNEVSRIDVAVHDRRAQAAYVGKDIGQFGEYLFDLFFGEFFTRGDVCLDRFALDVLHDEHEEKVAFQRGIEALDVSGYPRVAEGAQDIRFAFELVERLPGGGLGDIEDFQDDERGGIVVCGLPCLLVLCRLCPPCEPCRGRHTFAQAPLEDVGTDAVARLHSSSSLSGVSPLLSLAKRSCASACARFSSMPSSS